MSSIMMALMESVVSSWLDVVDQLETEVPVKRA